MSFRVFPATITPDGRKIPLIKEWRERSSTNPEDHKLWKELFNGRFHYFGVPTGQINDLLVLDVDVKGGGLDTIKRFHIPSTRSQRTISGGLHFFFKVPRDGRVYGNRVKFLPGLDIRCEGGYIIYYGADDKPILDAPQWLLDAISPVSHTVNTSPIKVDPSIAEKIIQDSLQTIKDAPDGERNNTLNTEAFKVGQLVASQSISREFAESALLKAALECGMPSYECRRTIESALKGSTAKPLTSPFDNAAPVPSFPIPEIPQPVNWTPLPFTREDLLNAQHLRRPQLFQDWSTEDIHITTADGGTGKTTLKLFEAVCLALGDRFLGFNCVQPGRTLYITGEDTAKKLAAMIGVIIRQMGLLENFPGFPEKVQTVLQSVIVKKDADLCLIVRDRNGFIHPNGDAMNKIMQAVREIKPKLIVFDPISSFWGSEAALNDMNKAVTKFLGELVEQSGACVEMINHMGKSSSANKDMTQFAGRGGSGLPSNSRVSRVLRSIGEDEYLELTGETLQPKQSCMVCVVNKFTDGSPLYNKQFLILREGYLFTRKNLTEKKQQEAEKNLSDMERVFKFVKEARTANKWPTQNVCVAHFMSCGDPLSKARTERSLSMLQFNGWLGEKLKSVENPDATIKEKTFVITDIDGKELVT